MKVLLIEDEPSTIAYLRQGLSENGYVVDVAETAERGLRLATDAEYDLIILDINLPDRDGWWVLSRLGNGRHTAHVLCLTCRDDVEDRVRGLDLGADDYLIKPFAFSELLARMRSILRRPSETVSNVYEVADLRIDPVKREVTRGDEVIRNLRPKEFLLLELLVRRAGEVLSRTTIQELVWNANFDFETNVVDVQIKRLREKIDAPFDSKLIHTVRGVGYVLEKRS